MATTATLSVGRSVGYGGFGFTRFDFVLIVGNTGATPINYVSGAISVSPGYSASTPSLMPPQSASLQVPATTGTLAIPFTMTFGANIAPVLAPLPAVYNIACFVSMSDGSVASSNTVAVTVIPVQAAIASVPGVYPPTPSMPSQYPELPATGHTGLSATYGWSADFYDNSMSGLLGAMPFGGALY